MVSIVFFSFHYERDNWRASVVRNSWVTKPDRKDAGFIDAASWEEIKKRGDDAIKQWIERELEGTSVTIVLIGAETSERKWVNHEIKRSCEKGNGLLGVYIHNIRDSNGNTDLRGKNPFENFTLTATGKRLSDTVPVYDWVNDDGYNSLAKWIEQVAPK